MALSRGSKTQRYVMPYLDQVLSLSPGETLALAIPPEELHSAKNTWYRALTTMALNTEYSLSMKPEHSHFLITRKGQTILAPFESTVMKPSQDKTPLSRALLTGIKLHPSQERLIEDIQSEIDLGASWDYILEAYGRDPATRGWLEKHSHSLIKQPSRKEIAENQALFRERFPDSKLPFEEFISEDPDEALIDQLPNITVDDA